MVVADGVRYSGANRCAIHTAFAERQIGYACPGSPTSISLGNPGQYGTHPRILYGASPTSGTSYKLYRSINAGPYELAASSTSSGQTDMVDYNARLEAPGTADVLRYFVTAEKNGVESEPTGILQINGYAWKNGSTPDHRTADAVPDVFALHGNFPNPFNPTTEIQLDLPTAARVQVVVYDLGGREVVRLVDGRLPAGRRQIRFNAETLSSGTYLYRIIARGEGWETFTATGYMTLVK